ncbi:NfeD family protein [Chloroflexota bacterium]
MTARLILAIVSTSMEELAIYVIWRWGLPELGIQLPLQVLIVVMVAWVIFSVTVFHIGTRALKRKVVFGLPSMMGGKGKAACPLDPEGLVKIKSELWGATSVDGDIDTGEKVTVVGQDGLKLMVCRSGNEKLMEE